MIYTLFLDIDGVLLEQAKDYTETVSGSLPAVVGKAAAKMLQWHLEGHRLILTTGRTEPLRSLTELSLANAGIIYDQLVMSVGSGPRIVINDIDPKHPLVLKALAINLERNKGIDDINLT